MVIFCFFSRLHVLEFSRLGGSRVGFSLTSHVKPEKADPALSEGVQTKTISSAGQDLPKLSMCRPSNVSTGPPARHSH
jgi:hypothetical protein